MYAPTSTNSPRSGRNSGDEDRFRDSETQGSSGPLRGTNARSASAGPEDGLTDFDGAGARPVLEPMADMASLLRA